MQPLPHHYRATAEAEDGAAAGHVTVRSDGLPDLQTNAPAEYDGPGDRWSPETLLMAAVADCYVLSFRAIARASSLEWRQLVCSVEGTLDKVDKVVRFTQLTVRARLTIPPASESRAERVLEKAEQTCLITNSLSAQVGFDWEVHVEE